MVLNAFKFVPIRVHLWFKMVFRFKTFVFNLAVKPVFFRFACHDFCVGANSSYFNRFGWLWESEKKSPASVLAVLTSVWAVAISTPTRTASP